MAASKWSWAPFRPSKGCFLCPSCGVRVVSIQKTRCFSKCNQLKVLLLFYFKSAGAVVYCIFLLARIFYSKIALFIFLLPLLPLKQSSIWQTLLNLYQHYNVAVHYYHGISAMKVLPFVQRNFRQLSQTPVNEAIRAIRR